MDKQEIKRELERQLAEINEKIEILDMMDERLLKIKELLERIEESKLSKKEEISIRKEIKELEDQVNLLGRKKNLQS